MNSNTKYSIGILVVLFSGLLVFGQNCSQNSWNPNDQLVSDQSSTNNQNIEFSSKATKSVIIDHTSVEDLSYDEMKQLILEKKKQKAELVKVHPNGDLEFEYPSREEAEKAVRDNDEENKKVAKEPSAEPTQEGEVKKDKKPLVLKRKMDHEVVKKSKDSNDSKEAADSNQPHKDFDAEKVALKDPKDHDQNKETENKEFRDKPAQIIEPNKVADLRKNTEKILSEIQQEQQVSNAASQLNAKAIMNASQTVVGYDNSDSPFFPPIADNMSLGSTSVWAAAYYLNSYNQAKTANVNINSPEGLGYLCSPAYIYPFVNGGLDTGSATSTIIEALVDFGCASMADYPLNEIHKDKNENLAYDPKVFPSVSVQKKALKNRLKEKVIIADFPLNNSSLLDVKQSIQNGSLVITEVVATHSMLKYNGQESNTGKCPDGSTSTFSYPNKVYASYDSSCKGVLGSFTATIVGYDDEKQAFKVAASFSSAWGDKGFIWIGYNVFKDSNFSNSLFYTANDFDKVPEVKAFLVVDSELEKLTTKTDKRSPIFYTIQSDDFYWDLSNKNSYPTIERMPGAELKTLSLVHDLTSSLFPNKFVSNASTLDLSTKFSKQDWDQRIDSDTTLVIKNVKLFVVSNGVEAEIKPLNWKQSSKQVQSIWSQPDNKPVIGELKLVYPSKQQLVTVNSEFKISPVADETSLPSGTVCSTKDTLPKGVILDKTTCVISGKSTAAKEMVIHVTAASSTSSTKGEVSVKFFNLVKPKLAYSKTVLKFKVNEKLEILPDIKNTNLTSVKCSTKGTLPKGVSLDTETCVISGTPTEVKGKTTVNITATNSSGSISSSVSFYVYKDVNIEYESKYELKVNASSSITPKALTDSTGCTTETKLANYGHKLDSKKCTITGKPTKELATTKVTIVSKNADSTKSVSFDLSILPPLPELMFSKADYKFKFSSGVSIVAKKIYPSLSKDVACSISPATLPEGITFDPSKCKFTGKTTKNVFAKSSFTVTLKSSGGTSNASLTLEVNK
jgi:hypothetical protein